MIVNSYMPSLSTSLNSHYNDRTTSVDKRIKFYGQQKWIRTVKSWITNMTLLKVDGCPLSAHQQVVSFLTHIPTLKKHPCCAQNLKFHWSFLVVGGKVHFGFFGKGEKPKWLLLQKKWWRTTSIGLKLVLIRFHWKGAFNLLDEELPSKT